MTLRYLDRWEPPVLRSTGTVPSLHKTLETCQPRLPSRVQGASETSAKERTGLRPGLREAVGLVEAPALEIAAVVAEAVIFAVSTVAAVFAVSDILVLAY